MSPAKQRIAIAEACGWIVPEGCTNHRTTPTGELIFFNPHTQDDPLPDYLNDLNAMHEAEKVLMQAQDYDYRTETLPKVCGDSSGLIALTATAAQRAEAFLRTIGKWEDDL